MPPVPKQLARNKQANGKNAADGDATMRPPRRTLLLHFDFFDALAYTGVMDWVRENDWALDASAFRTLSLPRMEKVDGIVMIADKVQTIDWLEKFECPIARIHTSVDEDVESRSRNTPRVELDSAAIGRMGAEHLLTLGRPHFVFYQRGWGADVLALRDAFVKTLAVAGHKPTVLDFTAENPSPNLTKHSSLEVRTSWLIRKLAHLPKPMAVMAEDDRFATDLVEAARSLGLRVPQDVAILGCDDNPMALGVSPISISSVDCNYWGLGYAAASLIGRMVAGETLSPQTIHVPPRRVIARDSTATYVGGHPGLNLVLQHLRQNFRRPLTVESLAQVAGLSVRGLQTAYRQEFASTIHEELVRLRVAAAEQLLEKTDLKLDAVAADTNLGDGKNLCRVFAKVHGISPDAWRRKGRGGSKLE